MKWVAVQMYTLKIGLVLHILLSKIAVMYAP
jgi:hypothetical protein